MLPYKLILMRGEGGVPGENKVPETDGNRLKLISHAIAEEGGLNANLTCQSVQLWIFSTGHPSIPLEFTGCANPKNLQHGVQNLKLSRRKL